MVGIKQMINPTDGLHKVDNHSQADDQIVDFHVCKNL
jgi:hypothetical protein